MSRAWADGEHGHHHVRVGDGRYLLSGRFYGHGRGSGAEFDVQMYWVYILDEGLLRRFEAHFDRQDALHTLGLKEWPTS